MSDEHELDRPEIKAILNATAEALRGKLPANWGFTLMLFSYGKNGEMFYISSARREDMISAMKEFIEKRAKPPGGTPQ